MLPAAVRPPRMHVSVQVLDAALADAPAVFLAERTFTWSAVGDRIPFELDIPEPPAGSRLILMAAVRARADEKLLSGDYLTTLSSPLDMRADGYAIEVPLTRIGID